MKFNKHQLRRISPYLLIGAFYIVALLAIGIGGDFPLNDDWAYAEGVRHLLLGEGLILPVVCATGLAHVGLGVFAAKLFGYSYTTLRICGLLVTLVGALAFFVAAATLRIPRSQATFLTLLYAASPILVNVSFSFMSDTTGLTLNIIFLACLFLGLSKKSLRLMLLAFMVLAMAVTVRQSALIFLVLSPFCLSRIFGSSKNRLVVFCIAVVPPILVAVVGDSWLLSRLTASGFSNDDYQIIRASHSQALRKCLFFPLEMALPSWSAVGQVLCYLAIFCLPLSPTLIGGMLGPQKKLYISPKWSIGVALLVLSSALVTVCVFHQSMPFSENILRGTTIGAQGLLGIIRNPLDSRARAILTGLSYVLAVPLVITLVSLYRRLLNKKHIWPVFVLCVSFFVCLAFLTLETMVRCTDRYYLIALAPTLLALGYFAKIARLNFVNWLSIGLLIVFAWYSIGGNHEYISSNRARWQAISWLEAHGVTAPDIDGGYEYNNLRDFTIFNSKFRGEPPRDGWRWWSVKGEKYLISYSPVPGYKTIHLESYYSLFDRKTRNIEVLERIGIQH